MHHKMSRILPAGRGTGQRHIKSYYLFPLTGATVKHESKKYDIPFQSLRSWSKAEASLNISSMSVTLPTDGRKAQTKEVRRQMGMIDAPQDDDDTTSSMQHWIEAHPSIVPYDHRQEHQVKRNKYDIPSQLLRSWLKAGA